MLSGGYVLKIKIYPSKVKGVIKAPPSKSYLHRVIISAALSNGESLINNVSLNDDVTMTINALKTRASITYSKNTLKIKELNLSYICLII